MMATRVDLQWFWLLLFAASTVPFAPWASDPVKYFRGGFVSDTSNDASNWILLTCSSFVSWIFAKGILNTATLGASFGVVGGLAYSAWFVAFFSVAFVAYHMRTHHGYRSLPEAIHARYGGLAAIAFGLAVAYRLEQEVWSNSLVVASFYGPVHSTNWWIAAVVSTAIPAFYCFTGGMRASLFTDVFQAVVKVVFLAAVVGVVGSRAPASFASFNKAGSCKLPVGAAALASKPACTALNPTVGPNAGLGTCADLTVASFMAASCNYTAIASTDICAAANGTWAPAACSVSQQPPCAAAGGAWAPRSMWSLEGGMDMLIVGLLQGALSYPFFDPVLTDRAFLGEPRTMVRSFITGGVMAILFIFLFSFVGIFGAMEVVLNPSSVPCDIYAGMLAGQPYAVARYFGTAVFSLVNLIFLVSSCSVLDSTFASTSKLFGPELFGAILRGRPLPPQLATVNVLDSTFASTSKLFGPELFGAILRGRPLPPQLATVNTSKLFGPELFGAILRGRELPPQLATVKHAWVGRFAIVFMAIVGTLPLLAGPSALDATTISGTMVVGLGPPVFALTFLKGYRPLVFHLPFWTGVAFGVVMQLSSSPAFKSSMNVSGFAIGSGHYATLLGFNVVSAVVCWALAGLALLDNRAGRTLERLPGDEADYDELELAAAGDSGDVLPVKDLDAFKPAAAAAPAGQA
ncbi:hypothetical protein OEZ86_013316 [Tetradesmus obliquus]|nr:hypothetical protein OEZ86_013316 [Tetradesmus obliquus]